MIVKKYEAPTMQKALDAVKKDLGKDAVILHTKTKKQNGLFGLWGKEMVEITASRDLNLGDNAPMNTTGGLIRYYKKTLQQECAPAPEKKDERLDLQLLHSDLNEVKHLVHSLLKRSKHTDVSSMGDELLEIYLLLIEQEVSEELSKGIIQKMRDGLQDDELRNTTALRQALVHTIQEMLPAIEPIVMADLGRARKVALVGPTGVGKTTTIAKLAADFSLRKKKDVALITVIRTGSRQSNSYGPMRILSIFRWKWF